MASLRVGLCWGVVGLAACSSQAFKIGSNHDAGSSADATVCVSGDPLNRGACVVSDAAPDLSVPELGSPDLGSPDLGPGDLGRGDVRPQNGCSDLLPSGLEVLAVFKAGPPPDLGHGGTLVDGVYDLTQDTIYQSSPTTQQFFDRETIRVTGNGTRVEYVSERAPITIVSTVAPVDASLNPTTVCPLNQGVGLPPYFTASPDQIEMIDGLYAKVFTRHVGPPPDAGTIPEAGTIASCSNLAAGGPTVAVQHDPGPVPGYAPGGTIADGIYDLTQFTRYNEPASSPPENTTDQETIRISGDATHLEYVSGVYHFSMVIAMNPTGGLLGDSVLCPVNSPSENMFVGPNYSAGGSTFISISGNTVKVFAARAD